MLGAVYVWEQSLGLCDHLDDLGVGLPALPGDDPPTEASDHSREPLHGFHRPGSEPQQCWG